MSRSLELAILALKNAQQKHREKPPRQHMKADEVERAIALAKIQGDQVVTTRLHDGSIVRTRPSAAWSGSIMDIRTGILEQFQMRERKIHKWKGHAA